MKEVVKETSRVAEPEEAIDMASAFWHRGKRSVTVSQSDHIIDLRN
jgi:hypothetical protein